MSLAFEDVRRNVKLARSLTMQGNYEMAQLFYQNSVQQIQSFLSTIDSQMRRKRWQSVSRDQFFVCFNLDRFLIIFYSHFNKQVQQLILSEIKQVKSYEFLIQVDKDSLPFNKFGKD